MKTLLAPIDFSPISDRVLAEAAQWTRALEGELVLVHVTEPAAGVVDYAVVTMSVAHVNDASVQRSGDRLRELEQQLRGTGLRVVSTNLIGSPVDEIVAEAQRRRADYIVMGSHGHSAFYDLLVGSTANGVLKRAGCPVLIVPPQAATEGREER